MPIVYLLPHPDLCPEGRDLEVKRGASLCQSLLNAGVAIEHACEMVAACATCHVHVRQGGTSLKEADDEENDQLDNAWGPGRPVAPGLLHQGQGHRSDHRVSAPYAQSRAGALIKAVEAAFFLPAFLSQRKRLGKQATILAHLCLPHHWGGAAICGKTRHWFTSEHCMALPSTKRDN